MDRGNSYSNGPDNPCASATSGTRNTTSLGIQLGVENHWWYQP